MRSSSKNRVSLVLILAIVAIMSSGIAIAKKGGNGQTGNGGGGGGNDTPDPDWSILAVQDTTGGATFVAAADCFAFNPDLKGPGIAYGGFYDRLGYITCANTFTSTGDEIDIKTLGVEVDEAGNFSSIWLRGRNPDNGVVYVSEEVTSFTDSGKPAPVTGNFTVQVRASIQMFSCGTSKLKGNTVCDQPAGTITVGDLEYDELLTSP
jgi:hypothetical protein